MRMIVFTIARTTLLRKQSFLLDAAVDPFIRPSHFRALDPEPQNAQRIHVRTIKMSNQNKNPSDIMQQSNVLIELGTIIDAVE